VNVHVSAAEAGRDIVFLHAIEPGPGQQAATASRWRRWPACPSRVLKHARHTLQALEAQAADAQHQVDLFAAPPITDSAAVSQGALEAAIAALNPDALSPRRRWKRSTSSKILLNLNFNVFLL